MPHNSPSPTPATAPQPTASPPKRVYLETLGCAKNQVDSEIMLGALASQGYALTPDPAQAEIIVVNTCAFLTAATEESIDRLLALSDFKTAGACEKLVCAGCLSARYRETLLTELPEVDALLGSSNFQELPLLLDELYAGREGPRTRILPKPHYVHPQNRQWLQQQPQNQPQTNPAPYVYVKIAEGCSNMCTFCNIPFLRGYFSSRPIPDVITEITQHVARGVREINIVSQDTSSYGVDLKDSTNLLGLMHAIDQLQGDFWVRLFYAYPNTFGEAEIEALATSRHIVPYLDLPFQHIDDGVLKAMNRRITEAEIRAKLHTLRQRIPHLALRTTFITGFPTETEAAFEKLPRFIEEGWFDHVGVFAYSHEDNIKSAALGDPVPSRIKHQRRKILMATQQRVSAAKNAARVGQRLRVLVHGPAEETNLLLQARAAFQGPEVDGVVLINEGQAEIGAFQMVDITAAQPYDLVGRLVG